MASIKLVNSLTEEQVEFMTKFWVKSVHHWKHQDCRLKFLAAPLSGH